PIFASFLGASFKNSSANSSSVRTSLSGLGLKGHTLTLLIDRLVWSSSDGTKNPLSFHTIFNGASSHWTAQTPQPTHMSVLTMHFSISRASLCIIFYLFAISLFLRFLFLMFQPKKLSLHDQFPRTIPA